VRHRGFFRSAPAHGKEYATAVTEVNAGAADGLNARSMCTAISIVKYNFN
jgi:hypothetical protein